MINERAKTRSAAPMLCAALLLAPSSACAQNDEPRDLAKPEVSLAAKATKKAWESAPAEKKALYSGTAARVYRMIAP